MKVTCETCSAVVERKPSTVAVSGRHFCSMRCYDAARASTERNAGHARAQCLYPIKPCEACGSMTNVDRHHRDENPANNDRSNVQFLCRRCHKRTHFGSLTHCLHGHEFTDENTRIDKRDHRHCRACARRWALAYYHQSRRKR